MEKTKSNIYSGNNMSENLKSRLKRSSIYSLSPMSTKRQRTSEDMNAGESPSTIPRTLLESSILNSKVKATNVMSPVLSYCESPNDKTCTVAQGSVSGYKQLCTAKNRNQICKKFNSKGFTSPLLIRRDANSENGRDFGKQESCSQSSPKPTIFCKQNEYIPPKNEEISVPSKETADQTPKQNVDNKNSKLCKSCEAPCSINSSPCISCETLKSKDFVYSTPKGLPNQARRRLSRFSKSLPFKSPVTKSKPSSCSLETAYSKEKQLLNDSSNEVSDETNSFKLIQKRNALRIELAEKEETLRKLKMVKMYRTKNNLDELEGLINKWREVCREGLCHIKDTSKCEPAPCLSQIMMHLQIDPAMLDYNADEDSFD